MLVDNHNRKINYLRLAVTDRCNLRCNYCMPENGIDFSKKNALFTIEELSRLSGILVSQGIDKIRITGGEPFVRKDLIVLLRDLTKMIGLKDISITTNATLIGPYLKELNALGIKNINVSLDAITRETFEKITRRDAYDTVYDNILRMIAEGFNVRINYIVLKGQNTGDILPMLALAKNYNVSVRYLEEMPFNGGSRHFEANAWDYKRILSHIKEAYPDFEEIPSEATSTSMNYKIPGFKGTFGVIPSFSRTFCGSCNRLRITATGDVITCLYAQPCTNIRDILRGESSGEKVKEQILKAIGSRAKTGFEAQQQHQGTYTNSMTTIGG
ncbi:GTP 3',8-cyclase MoaA [Maribacter polysaccharolyticus]|uniref:GTP 3',8-cyclase MoaA n=1 Tax=Maribacter polysaccharolyticus TaxID=3020831 RepID=UPI00237FB9ED|nr:GTP 3',8-cyclase MoaA [Maribacter polysaccharolyticus]MDE3743820.1 GTP 3',8-cyclase MoaA [Maribacter polysaccharolyticus]